MIKLLLYFIFIIFFYRTLSKIINLPRSTTKQPKNSKGESYKDAEFEEID